MSVTALYPAGTAPVKAEFVQPITCMALVLGLTASLRYLVSAPENLQAQIDDASAEEGTNHATRKRMQEGDLKDDSALKKPRLTGAERRKLTKDEKKAQRGSNKGRRWAKVRDEVDLCWRFAGSGKCDFGSEYVSHTSSPCRSII